MTRAASFVSVSKSYRRGTELVMPIKAMDFTIDAGELVALTGPSGSGKTTILNLLAGYDAPDSGDIWVGDINMADVNPKRLDRLRSSYIGFIFQQFNLVSGISAYENIGLALVPRRVPARERRARAETLLEQLGLAGLGNRKPSQLSGGQQQRIAVARALAGEPQLLLADEPTAALDRVTADKLLADLRSLTRSTGLAILMSTHDARCMDVADRIITLDVRGAASAMA